MMKQEAADPFGIGNEGRSDPEGGVSEIVGTIMLITLVVAASGIIAMFLFSQASPTEIPDVNYMVGSNYPAVPTYLYLYHNGGDDLRAGDFSVVVDGVSMPYALEGGGEYWTMGNRLDIDISAMPALPSQVALVYNSTSGGTYALHSASVNISTGPGTVRPDILVTWTTAPPAPAAQPAIKEVYYRNYSRLMRPSVNTDYSLYLNMTIGPSAGNSWLIASCRTATGTRTVYPLLSTDKVNITLRTGTTSFKASGRDNRMWNISASPVSIGIYNQSRNSWRSLFSTASGRTLFDAVINDCSSYGSTLAIQNTTPAFVQTTLVINNTVIIQGFDRNNIVINRIIPENPGIFTLTWDTANDVGFMGFASDTRVNGMACNNASCPGLI